MSLLETPSNTLGYIRPIYIKRTMIPVWLGHRPPVIQDNFSYLSSRYNKEKNHTFLMVNHSLCLKLRQSYALVGKELLHFHHRSSCQQNSHQN
ncbi:Os10g0474250 [Oryza sativa Japonica Group]|uniref:Os10g0474250 protein n=1 Tax=Oryza sativa subsp. japonica TaxID=39947 RepID=A0A0P0XVA2_ORYSJ|nr:hypothetical protein EE612_051815 [Oryza sativa]BAT11281.1 Os10g0474250 [Oryza sativa Japonica Group]